VVSYLGRRTLELSRMACVRNEGMPVATVLQHNNDNSKSFPYTNACYQNATGMTE
jgi:hypothetical protein